MSLRTKLILALLGLCVLGMGISVGSTFGAVQDWRGDQLDSSLRLTADTIATELTTQEYFRSLDDGPGWKALARQGLVPSYARIHKGRSTSFHTIGEKAPEIDVKPDHFVTSDGWKFYARTHGKDNDLLVVGLRTHNYDQLTHRVGVVGATTAVLALLGIGLFGFFAIRRGMRPLEEISEVAGAIGRGELARRVPVASPGTEVGKLSTALNEMLAQRQLAEERLRQFVADASHELRTPVATIRGYAELFRRGAASRPDDLAKAMDRIESEAARMGTLVDELLLLARLDQGRPLEREPVDLVALAGDTVADFLAAAPNRIASLDVLSEAVVIGDGPRLRQVLANLLGNVRQHTPEDAVTVVRVGARDGRAELSVIDTGPGLPTWQHNRVFERFYRADESRSRQLGGAGLGLSIVAAVIEAHNGEVALHSTPTGGLTCTLTLPLAAASA